MIMAASSDPQLCSTNVVEDVDFHDDIVGLNLSYVHNECFFTVFITNQFPSGFEQTQANDPAALVIRELIDRFNEACTWTSSNKTVEDVDKRLDPIWQEAEDLVKAVAFERITALSLQHTRRVSTGATSRPDPTSMVGYLFPTTFNLQLVPESGGLSALCRPELPPSLPFSVETGIFAAPGLLTIKPEDIRIQETCKAHVLKVQVDKDVFCCKLNNTGGQTSFLREFEMLQQIHNSSIDDIMVPKLRGVVTTEGGVIGLLMDWIETDYPDLLALLRHQDNVTSQARSNWANQITKTLGQLHALDVTWGDAKTTNILIDTNDRAWLIDFGGGFTKGWVDETLYDTQAGDLQGLENTLSDIFGKR